MLFPYPLFHEVVISSTLTPLKLRNRFFIIINIVAESLKAGIVELEETFIARQWLSKQVSASINTQATVEELMGTMFSIQSVQSGYKEEFS
jgi:hypothetical protein